MLSHLPSILFGILGLILWVRVIEPCLDRRSNRGTFVKPKVRPRKHCVKSPAPKESNVEISATMISSRWRK